MDYGHPGFPTHQVLSRGPFFGRFVSFELRERPSFLTGDKTRNEIFVKFNKCTLNHLDSYNRHKRRTRVWTGRVIPSVRRTYQSLEDRQPAIILSFLNVLTFLGITGSIP